MKKIRVQERIKRIAGKCHLCPEDDYKLLDAHRINPGREGGTYNEFNAVPLCANCHRRVESGEIEILGRHPTSKGTYVLHIKRNNKEEWIWPN